ncbi:MAG: hypothetical protein IJC65_08765 [Oscillospiraceae bacterium]|nr:hypothetical protein [Oscillospiraceae bacterium]
MKKATALMLSLIMSASLLSGCSDDDKPETPEITSSTKFEIGEKQKEDKNRSEALIKKMADKGERTINIVQEYGDKSNPLVETGELTMYITANEDAIYTYLDYSSMGSQANLRTWDGDYYMYPDEKTYTFYRDDGMYYEKGDELQTFIDDLGEFKGSYDVKIEGEVYDADLFGDGGGYLNYLVFDDDGNIFACITAPEEQDAEADSEIYTFEASATADKSKLSVPKDYKERS